MQDIPQKFDFISTLGADEFNQFVDETENTIKATNITLSGGDVKQMAKSITNHVAIATYYTDSGVVNAYDLTIGTGTVESPTEYFDGMIVRFLPANTNTGGSTINVAGLGVKDIKNSQGVDLDPSNIVANEETMLVFDLSNDYFKFFYRTGQKITTVTTIRNLIIGGDFSINPWQRGTNFAGLTTIAAHVGEPPNSSSADRHYTADRFEYAVSSGFPGIATIEKVADAPTVAEFGYYTDQCCGITVTTDHSILGSGDFAIFSQNVEGYDLRPIAQRNAIFSIWLKTTLTGTYYMAFRNIGQDSSLVSPIVIDPGDANTWKKYSIFIPPSVLSGTWDLEAGLGMSISLVLSAGSGFNTTAPDSWETGDFLNDTGATNFFGTPGAVMLTTGWQLEEGSILTPQEPMDFHTVLEECERFYHKSYLHGVDPGTALIGGGFAQGVILKPGTGAQDRVPLAATLSPKMHRVPDVNWYADDGQKNAVNLGVNGINTVISTNGRSDSWTGIPKINTSYVDVQDTWGAYTADAEIYTP